MKRRIKALKVGDRAEELISGQSNLLKIHSVFQHAVNFINSGDYLITVLEDKHGSSSQSITVKSRDLEELILSNISKEKCFNNLIDVNEAERVTFGQPLEIEHISEKEIIRNVKECSENFIRYGNLSEFSASIFGQDNMYRKYTKDLLKNLQYGYFNKDMQVTAEALRGFIGLGQGLTPSGDDFICGFISVLYCCTAFKGLDYNWTRNMGINLLEGIGDKTTIVSYNMLRAYLKGELSEHMQGLMKGILAGGGKELTVDLNRVLQTGSTSGSDMVAGVLFGFHMVLRLGGFI